MSSNGTWENARKHARLLESRLDVKLSSYSRLATQISSSGGLGSPGGSGKSKDRAGEIGLEEEGVGGYKLLEEEIEELLEKLAEALDTLTTILNSPDVPPSTSMTHAASRHRDALDDYRRDFVRLRNNVESAMQRNDLLGSVRRDIDAYKSSLPRTASGDTDALLQERSRIDSSNRMTDDILSQAYATREDLGQQRGMVAGINSRMGGLLSTMPGINSLLSMINSRRRRDTLIVGCVAGVCTIIILAYVTGF